MFLSRALIGSTTQAKTLPQYNGFDFNGSTQYINSGNDSSLQLSTNFALSAWVYRDVTSRHVIMSKFNFSGNQRAISFEISDNQGSGDNLLLALSSDGSSGNLTKFQTTATITQQSFTFVTATYDGAFVKLYINGVEELSTAHTASVHNSTADFLIGSIDAGTGAFFDGSLTQTMVFNSALSASDITELYNNGIPLSYNKISTSITNNCVLAYEMSSNDNSLSDSSSNTNDGTAVASVTSDGQLITWSV